MRATLLMVCLALVAAACGSDEADQTTSSTTTVTTTSSLSTTTLSTTTTTTEPAPAGPIAPLTGLEVDATTDLDRRAIVVKIDNHPKSRPQTGLAEADMVIELPVEGITRFVGVFHSIDPPVAGPVRSMRPTDWQLASLFDAPIVVSGGQDWVIARNRNNGVFIIGEVGSPVTFRSSSRSAPHNLYVDVAAARERADERDVDDAPPEPIWEFGELPPGAERAEEVRLAFSSSLVAGWEWTGGSWLRTTNGTAHEWIDTDGAATQIRVDVLVVLSADTYLVEPPPGGGPARAVESIGAGDAWIFAGGRVVEGRWERESGDDGFVLTDADGEPLAVPAGRAWVSLFPDDRTPEWS